MVTESLHVNAQQGVHIVFRPVGGPNMAKLTQVMAHLIIFFQYDALDSRNLMSRRLISSTITSTWRL
ncbi:MAG: hypothetical protein QM578_24290 [Pantoea sp.]